MMMDSNQANRRPGIRRLSHRLEERTRSHSRRSGRAWTLRERRASLVRMAPSSLHTRAGSAIIILHTTPAPTVRSSQ
eukprot:420748-Rhodomonas_salina.1